jgi:hypothetical protein
MKLLGLALVAAAAAQSASVIDYSKLPECAKNQCTILSQAEANCVPPAAPVTSQAIYQSCVCQSALLTGLRSSGAQCQQTGCSAEDATKISQYYIALCAGPVVQPAAPTTTTATGTSTTSSQATTSTGKPAGTAGDANRLHATEEKKGWYV